VLRTRNLDQLRPRGQAARGGEHVHIGADLGDDRGRRHPVHAGDLHQQPVLRLIGLKLGTNAGVECFQVAVDGFQGAQLHAEQETLMLAHAPLQRGFESGVLAPHPPARETRHLGTEVAPSGWTV